MRMSWLTDAVLLYGGIGLAVLSAIALSVYVLIEKNRETALRAQLCKEYGDPPALPKEKK